MLPSEYKKKRFCFSIETPKRTYYLCANSEADKNSWVAALCDERDRVQDKGPPPAALSPRLHPLDLPIVGKYAPAPSAAGAPGGQVVKPAPKTPATIGVEDFELMRVIGKGSFGKVRSLPAAPRPYAHSK